MKYIFIIIILLFVLDIGCTKTELIRTPTIDANAKTLVADTTVNTLWDGNWKVFDPVDANGVVHKLHGSGTFTRWIIDAPFTEQIFDSSITIGQVKVYNADEIFSTRWYGSNPNSLDNWWYLQKSINVCKSNNLACVTLGSGNYNFSKTLDFSTKLPSGQYLQSYNRFYGDASYWNPNAQTGTTFTYTGTTGPAINFQLQKGSKLQGFFLFGQYRAPVLPDSIYVNLTEAQYTDRSLYHLPDTYTGIGIDYYFDGISRSGSTGVQISDVGIGGFSKAIAFSANGWTQNDENNLVQRIYFVDNNKYGIITGQPQEKNNVIENIYSWGHIYNVFKNFGGGQYSLNHANIAGYCVEVFQAQIGHWFGFNVNDFFCENIGRVCNFSGQMPVSVTNSNFDLNFFGGSLTRAVVISNTTYLNFHGCTFRYYDGYIHNIYAQGYATIPLYPDNYFGGGTLIYK